MDGGSDGRLNGGSDGRLDGRLDLLLVYFCFNNALLNSFLQNIYNS